MLLPSRKLHKQYEKSKRLELAKVLDFHLHYLYSSQKSSMQLYGEKHARIGENVNKELMIPRLNCNGKRSVRFCSVYHGDSTRHCDIELIKFYP